MTSGPITSWQIEGEKIEAVTGFFLPPCPSGSKITANNDCSHEIKRRFLYGRRTLTNLDSILKSKDITLPTNVCIVRGMAFPIFMYRCESWTIKKTECQKSDAFELWCWRRLLRVPWEINPEYSLEGLTLKLNLQYFGI